MQWADAMWPFTPRTPAPPAKPARDIAIAYGARKWSFFLESRAFPDDVPLHDRVRLFTAQYLTDVIAYDARLKAATTAELHGYLLDGIVESGITTRVALDAALHENE